MDLENFSIFHPKKPSTFFEVSPSLVARGRAPVHLDEELGLLALRVDRTFYIVKKLLPPLSRILDVCGVNVFGRRTLSELPRAGGDPLTVILPETLRGLIAPGDYLRATITLEGHARVFCCYPPEARSLMGG